MEDNNLQPTQQPQENNYGYQQQPNYNYQQVQPQNQQPPYYQYPPYPQPQYQPLAPTSGMCIAGFVCSLALFGVLGLIFSIIGMKECNEKGLNGKGLGIAGLIISIVKIALIVLYFTCLGCACTRYGYYRW